MSAGEYPNDLIERLRSGSVIPFIGSGFSIPSGAPSWNDVLLGLMDDLDKNGISATELRELYERGRLTSIDAAELHSTLKSKYSLRDFVVSSFGRPMRPNDYHSLLTRLPFDVLITTNWDNLIERGYEEAGIAVHKIWKDEHLPYYNAKQKAQIVKAHGTLDDPNSVVIAADEYASYEQNRPYLYGFLKTVFLTETVLFLGFSLADPNIRNLLESIRAKLGGQNVRNHYAVLYDEKPRDIQELAGYNIRVVEVSAANDRTEAIGKWLQGLVGLSRTIGKGNREKATMINDALRDEIKSAGPGAMIRTRAALGVISNPKTTDPGDPMYGSPEQDRLEIEMGSLVRKFLSKSKQNILRCILHINPAHQREKGYQWRHLRQRFIAMKEFVETYPSQIEIAHSPIPVDMNQVILGRVRSFVSFKRGEAIGYERLTMNTNRWVVDADISNFDDDFDGIVHLNKHLAAALAIDVSDGDWPTRLSLRLLEMAIKVAEHEREVITCDFDGTAIGRAPRDEAHSKGIRHKSVHLHLIDQNGGKPRILVQRRPKSADLYGGMLDVSVAGHPEQENIEEEAAREAYEELGIRFDSKALQLIGRRTRKSNNDVEVVDVYVVDASGVAGQIEEKFTRDVDSVHWLEIGTSQFPDRLVASGTVRYGSLRLATRSTLSAHEFVPGALDEIAEVIASRKHVVTPPGPAS